MFSAVTHKIRGKDIMPTNFAKTLVWKHEYDVKLWRQKSAHQIKMTTICQWMNPHMKIFCVRHCRYVWVNRS